MSKFLRHVPCPNCSSSDAGALYADGHIYCFSCQQTARTADASTADASTADAATGNEQEQPTGEQMQTPRETTPTTAYRDLVDRGIKEDTCKQWSYRTAEDNVHYAAYKDSSGGTVATKIRTPEKGFSFVGKPRDVGLYGQWLWSPNEKKRIVITEGEIDALTVSQLLQGKGAAVVSIPNGAASAVASLTKAYDYLSGFGHIVIMFDQDEPGQAAATKCAELFPPGKVSIAQLPEKDPNKCLTEGKASAVVDQVFTAKIYRPDGIVDGADLWETLQEVEDTPSAMFPWDSWNQCFGGLRAGEVTMLTAGSGIGKSSIAREIFYHLANQGKRVGIIMLEETPAETTLELMSLYLNKRLRLNDRVTVTPSEKEEAFQKTCGTGRYFFYDTKGMFDVESIMAKMIYMRKALNCDYILFDNITVSVAGIDAGSDERRTIDRLMSGLRKLAVGTGVGFVVVSHLRRPSDGTAHEEGSRVTLSQLRGSGNIVNFSNQIIGMERDQQSADSANKMKVRSLKSRLYAKTGLIGDIFYDEETGRLTEAVPGDFTASEPKDTGF